MLPQSTNLPFALHNVVHTISSTVRLIEMSVNEVVSGVAIDDVLFFWQRHGTDLLYSSADSVRIAILSLVFLLRSPIYKHDGLEYDCGDDYRRN